MEAKKKENTGYNEEQIKDAKKLCDILDTVPREKRNVFVAIASAFMDGMAAGEAIATGRQL